MAYTPELNRKYSAILRRIAWSMGIPMTKAIQHVLDRIIDVMDKKIVCDACKDRTCCADCVFCRN